MSTEPKTTNSNPDPVQRPPVGPTRAEQRREIRAQVGWWVKLFVQPILAVAAIILVIAGFGFAQRFGWFTSNELETAEAAAAGEDVLYICPMVCVPPSKEPGKCPVCGMELKAQKASGDSKDKYGLTLDQASIRVANIKTVAAKSAPLVKQFRVIGKIGYDEGSLATISAYVDGRLEKLFADYTGVKVAEGDELALLYSPDLYSSQVTLLESLKLLDGVQSSNQRIDDRNRRLYEVSRQRLIESGLTGKQVDEIEKRRTADSRVRIVSPIAGTVIEKMAVEGQYVKTGQAIYKVADLSTVWLMLELFPKDAANIRFGQKVVTRIQSLPGNEFAGRVAFIDPTVNPKTQTVGVRVVIRNERGVIRVGDFATATISADVNSPGDQRSVYDPELAGKWISPRHPHIISDGPGQCSECGIDLVPASEFGFESAPIARQHHVVVPRNAVLMAGDESVVYVETDPGRFEFRQVEIGQIVGNRISIVSGVSDGEQVVANATVLMDSAFSMAGKPSLIDPNKARSVAEREQGGEIEAAMAELSEEDRKLAMAQKFCPVGDMPLGSMGTPIKIDVNGQPVFICCNGCQESLLGDPQKYLDILANRTAEKPDDPTSEIPAIQPPGDELPEMELPQMDPPSNDDDNDVPTEGIK